MSVWISSLHSCRRQGKGYPRNGNEFLNWFPSDEASSLIWNVCAGHRDLIALNTAARNLPIDQVAHA